MSKPGRKRAMSMADAKRARKAMLKCGCQQTGANFSAHVAGVTGKDITERTGRKYLALLRRRP